MTANAEDHVTNNYKEYPAQTVNQTHFTTE
jgi:hypothetical protein